MKRLAILLVLAALPASAQISIKGGGGSSGGSISTPVSVANGGTGNANGDGLLATCTDSVGTDAYACSSTSTPGCPASLAASEPVLFVAGTANTGAATFDYCALGAKALVKTVGGISTALATGDILAKQPVLVRYNATDDDWKMISAVSTAAAGGSLTVGTTAIASGTATRVLRESAGNLLTEDANLVNDGSTVTIGTGITGTAKALVINSATSTGRPVDVQVGGSTKFAVESNGSYLNLISTGMDISTPGDWSLTNSNSGLGAILSAPWNANGDTSLYTAFQRAKLNLKYTGSPSTTGLVEVGSISHDGNVTPAAGYGQQWVFKLKSSTTTAQDAGAIATSWTTATHVSRTAKVGIQNVNNAGALSTSWETQTGHAQTVGTAPAVSSCGTSPSTVTGSDGNGRLTTGSGGTVQSCTLTFAVAYTDAPACVANNETAIKLIRAVATTTTLVIDAPVAGDLTSSVLTYICRGM